ncbi:nucleoside hydrolase [Candidatus Woesearchaeota archaeon]|nr:nucleoside hydrolase [Candidatus Woesearchaeota archaeon]
MNKKKIIIDTDPGHDDAMALMLAVKSNEFDILAITTVAGNSTIENVTRNARYIMNKLNSNVPIYSGEAKPLDRELIKAVVHGKSGLEGIDPTNEPNLTNNAVDKIIELVRDNENLTLVTLGPLTNIAKAINKNPEVMSNVKEIVMMGGAIKVPGNKNRVGEFNFFVDPLAAKIVFKFPIKKKLIPLDACNHVRLSLEDFERINSDLREPVLKMAKPFISNISKFEGVKAALMYDPLTIFAMIKPESATTKEYNIDIEAESELTRGMAVADLRTYSEEIPNVLVYERIDAEDFKEYFIKTLSDENEQ